MFASSASSRRARGRGRGRGPDPMALLFAVRAWEEGSRAWRRASERYGFEPYGALLTLALVTMERANAHLGVIPWETPEAVCPNASFSRLRGRGRRTSTSVLARAGEFAMTCLWATCAHGSDVHAVYYAGSLFAKTMETERRIRATLARGAGEATTAAATAAFTLVLGAITNAVAATSATYAFGLGDSCFNGCGGLVFALKTYRARADFAAGARGRVSFFGFIDVPAEMASLAEIAILFLLDSSPSALNLYASGAAVGFVLAANESRAMRCLDRATRGVAALLGFASRPSIRPGTRIALTNMRNGSLNGQWGTVTRASATSDEVSVTLDENGSTITALRSNLIVV